MDGNLQRAWALHRQGRHEDAIQFAQQSLSDNVDEVSAYLVIALSKHALRDPDAAMHAVERAIECAPDQARSHYVKAVIQFGNDHNQAALAAIRVATELEPEDADYHSFHGEILLIAKGPREALEAADRALRLDPTHQGALSVRGRALSRLGETDAAKHALDSALAEDPENPHHHASRGWLALQRREFDGARFHFAEALRRDPHLEWARLGLVEALKAKHRLYRWMLAYLLWIQRIEPGRRWMLAIGAVVIVRIARAYAKTHPEHALYIGILVGAYGVFVLTSWLCGPLFDFLLLADRFGRQVLSATEKRIAIGVVGCLSIAIGCAVIGWFVAPVGMVLAVGFASVSLPIAAIPNATTGWPRGVMTVYAGLCLAVMVGAAGLAVVGSAGAESATHAVVIVFLLAILSTWVGSILGSIRVKR